MSNGGEIAVGARDLLRRLPQWVILPIIIGLFLIMSGLAIYAMWQGIPFEVWGIKIHPRDSLLQQLNRVTTENEKLVKEIDRYRKGATEAQKHIEKNAVLHEKLTEFDYQLHDLLDIILLIMFGTTDIHRAEINYATADEWHGLYYYSEMLLEFRELMKKIKHTIKGFEERQHYAILRANLYKGRYGSPLEKSDARKIAFRELENYKKSPYKRHLHYYHYAKGVYNRDVASPPNFEEALSQFNLSIENTPTGEFWINPQYSRLLIYEENGNVSQCMNELMLMTKSYENARRIEPLYFGSLLALAETYAANDHIADALKTLERLTRALEKHAKNPELKNMIKMNKDVEILKNAFHIWWEIEKNGINEKQITDINFLTGKSEYVEKLLQVMKSYLLSKLYIAKNKEKMLELEIKRGLSVELTQNDAAPKLVILCIQKKLKNLGSETVTK